MVSSRSHFNLKTFSHSRVFHFVFKNTSTQSQKGIIALASILSTILADSLLHLIIKKSISQKKLSISSFNSNLSLKTTSSIFESTTKE